jgi:hypothetical protein
MPRFDPFLVVTAAIAGGASMLLTSQNRESVLQATFANAREVVLAAVVAHRKVDSKRRHFGMRRTRRPLGMSMRPDSIESGYRPARGDWQSPAGCRMGLTLYPRLWASLVLSKTSRG